MSVTLEASAATAAEIDISYHVDGASWRPLYDLTLDGERLAVSYLAEVRQETGEDWPATDWSCRPLGRGCTVAARAEPVVHRPCAAASRPLPVMRRSMAMAAAAGAEGAPKAVPAMPMAAPAPILAAPPPPPPVGPRT